VELDMPGIISQLKSVVQFICGHVGGVAETQKNFPGMSHAGIGGTFLFVIVATCGGCSSFTTR
jgi:hypothetical protein